MARSSSPNHSSRSSACTWRLRTSRPVQARLNSSRNFFTTWYQSRSNDAAPCQAKKPAMAFCSERCPSVKNNHRRATKPLLNRNASTKPSTECRLLPLNVNPPAGMLDSRHGVLYRRALAGGSDRWVAQRHCQFRHGIAALGLLLLDTHIIKVNIDRVRRAFIPSRQPPLLYLHYQHLR